MKRGKQLTALALALVMMLGLMAEAGAAGMLQEVSAYLNYGITVTYNGEPQTLQDANGNAVYPISYNGTTYLPVRAVSNMLGIEVDWDDAAQTVLLTGTPAGTVSAGSGGGTVLSAGSQETVTAYLNYGITVTYNGEVQTLQDANGNQVYPLSYSDTTYLPVRAVSNMLGVAVDWDEATQTVILGNDSGSAANTPDTGTAVPSADTVHVIGLVDGLGNAAVSKDDPESSRESLREAGYSDEEINRLFENMNDVFWGAKTSEDAQVLGKDHIGCGWVEIDWSTAGDSYVKVTVNELPEGPSARCIVRASWDNNGKRQYGDSYSLMEGEWNIPLLGGSTEYVVEINLGFLSCEHYRTDEERIAQEEWSNHLTARFDAEITNPDYLWLLSTPDLDFAHAPKTCAAALEITKNCKTDAEKITAIFNYVANTIKYDTAMYERDVKEAQEREREKEESAGTEASTERAVTCMEDEVNGQHILPPETIAPRDLDLDNILTSKTGVCRHYAALMTGMLRSLGIPCKYVTGDIYTGKIIEGFSPDGWGGHAWVAVSPDTSGLNKSSLGAGTEPDGWVRLDPTNAGNKAYTAKDSNYRTEKYQ